jgi:mycofactocin precursor
VVGVWRRWHGSVGPCRLVKIAVNESVESSERSASFDTGSPASIRWRPMDDTVTQQDATEQATADQRVEELLDDELLVEEISIDGMCGVY